MAISTGSSSATTPKRVAKKAASKPAQSGIGRRRAAAQTEGGAAYQQRRAEIKAAAADLFKKEGFRGTSIGRIAQALGMDRATLYYYVGSKEELFEDVVTTAVRANVSLAEAIRHGPGAAPDKLRALITSLMDSYAENYPFLYVFIQENLTHMTGSRTAWSKEMRALNKQYEDAVVDIISDGLTDGSIRPVAEAWVMAYGLIGMVGWTNRWFNPQRSPVDAATIGKAYAEMLLNGLIATQAKPAKAKPAKPQQSVSGRSSAARVSPGTPAHPPKP